MDTLINKLRDKANQVLYSFAKLLGEDFKRPPVSRVAQQKACESIQIDLPFFRTLLPYETIDEHLIFINKNSAGFGLQLAVAAGADESLVKTMAEMIKNKLAPNIDLTVMLYKHHHINASLAKSYEPIIARDDIYAELAKQSLSFHQNAALHGYKNLRNVSAQLADYCCYFFFSMPLKASVVQTLILLRQDIESEFKAAGLYSARLSPQELQMLLRTIVSPNLNTLDWPELKYDEACSNIADVIPSPSTIWDYDDRKINISSADEDGYPINTLVTNCEIKAWPQSFALWQTPDLFANILRAEYGISCPFLISITIRGVDQEKMKALAKRKAQSLQKNANAFQVFLRPSIIDEARDWQMVHQESSKDNVYIVPVFYNLMLFTTHEKEREHVAKAIAAYRQQGFTLQQAPCTQWLRFLGSLPFTLTEGLFTGFKTLGLIKKLTHFSVANLLPIVADFKGSSAGLLLPTYRHQLSFLDTFDDKLLPISNYNRITIASPGAGKTQFELAQILDGLSRGEIIYVIDIGQSYKHLCSLVGGTYIDASTLTLNPFTLFDFEGSIEVKGEQLDNHLQISDLLAIMASPSVPLLEVQKVWLTDAVLMAWEQKGSKACIDDVLEAIDALMKNPRFANDHRLSDLHLLLHHYGSKGIYGHIFNSPTPLLSGSNFVVLEMGSLKKQPKLLTIVMFVMIVIIQGQFYHSDRRIKKRCIIDEAWSYLKGSNPIAAGFIEQGFRTARKHNGGFAVIIHNLSDTTETLQGQAIAAAADTKIIMRQGDLSGYVAKHPDAFTPLQQTLISSFGEAKNQGFSEMMIQYGKLSTYHRFFSDPFARVLFSTAGAEFAEIEALVNEGLSITEAVTKVMHKYYGDLLCH